jgi:hypothetical protein
MNANKKNPFEDAGMLMSEDELESVVGGWEGDAETEMLAVGKKSNAGEGTTSLETGHRSRS